MLAERLSLEALGLIPGIEVQWLSMLGLFLFIAGFIIGLGATTVIDIHGLLGYKSAYWTEATTRTHKVTKPMIWVGIVTATIGAMIFYRGVGLYGVPLLQAIILIPMLINGSFLSFYVSPFMLKREREGRAGELLPLHMQVKVAISLIISVICWWSQVFLLVWFLNLVG